MDQQAFRRYAHQVIDMIADYLEQVERFPVQSKAEPGSVRSKIPDSAPVHAQSFEHLMHDLDSIILPGITHWQHPGFMALFPSNSSYPSLLAEFIIAGLGVNAMVWETSPAATELEESMMQWLREMFCLPQHFSGVIHDTASTSTLVAIISAREQFSNYAINENGFSGYENMILYCSEQTHYSIEKDAKAAGIGKSNVKKIGTDHAFAMDPGQLEAAIQSDLEQGKKPFMVVATLGTTSSLAFDPLFAIGSICKKYGLWLHIDAAYAGTAFILPEYQHYLKGIEFADSYVFNPHKWMFTNFDCSVYFMKDADHLIRVFTSNPDYLKRTIDEVTNYKDWGINLGRRFRALKLWFVLRMFGVEGIQQKIRHHIQLATAFYDHIRADKKWELMAPFHMNVLCFRLHPEFMEEEEVISRLNEQIVKYVNAGGHFFLSGTRLNNKYVIRVVIGQTHVEERHVAGLIGTLEAAASALLI